MDTALERDSISFHKLSSQSICNLLLQMNMFKLNGYRFGEGLNKLSSQSICNLLLQMNMFKLNGYRSLVWQLEIL